MPGLVEPIRKERLDKFLFFARAIKSRTLAQKFIETGAVRVNSERTDRSDYKVGAGDVLTMALHNRIVIWRIVDCGVRRGPAPEAQGLYQDLSPAPLPKETYPPTTPPSRNAAKAPAVRPRKNGGTPIVCTGKTIRTDFSPNNINVPVDTSPYQGVDQGGGPSSP